MVLTVESASQGNGPESRLKSHFVFLVIAVDGRGVLFSRQKMHSEVYKKNEWMLVAVWTNIDKKEAYRRVAVIMTADFEVAGGPSHTWGGTKRKEVRTVWI